MAERKPKQKSAPMEGNISFEFERQDDTLIVKLAGEADLLGSAMLKQALATRLTGVNKIVFDLGQLEFADSYFLRFLIKLRKRLGGVSSVKVQNVRPNVDRIFEVTGLDKLFK